MTVSSPDIAIIAGYALYSADEYLIVQSATDLGSDSYQLEFSSAYVAEATDTFRVDVPIPTRFRTLPVTFGDVCLTKKLSEIQFNFRNDDGCSEIDVSFINDTTSSSATVLKSYAKNTSAKEGWGFGAWGTFEWGDVDVAERKYITDSFQAFRTLTPRAIMRARWLQIEVFHDQIEPIDLQTVTVNYQGGSGRRKNR